MTDKYSKYFVTRYVKPKETNSWSPVYRPQDRTKILRLDKNSMRESKLFVECTWFWPAMVEDRTLEQRSTKPHVHDYDEVLGLVGTNRDDPHDLGGESEVYLGGERHIINKSCLIYLPAGLEHGPFREINMKRPIFHFECRSVNCE
jgi:hypothetical protein